MKLCFLYILFVNNIWVGAEELPSMHSLGKLWHDIGQKLTVVPKGDDINGVDVASKTRGVWEVVSLAVTDKNLVKSGCHHI